MVSFRRADEVHQLHAVTWCSWPGGGVTQIVMPYMTEGIRKHVPEFEAWRWAFFLPGCLFIVITILILLFGQVVLASAPPPA